MAATTWNSGSSTWDAGDVAWDSGGQAITVTTTVTPAVGRRLTIFRRPAATTAVTAAITRRITHRVAVTTTSTVALVATFHAAGEDTTPPTPPTVVTAVAVSASRVNVAWSGATDDVGVTGYQVYRDGSLLVNTGAVLTYADNTVAPLTTYDYRVRARDAAGNFSAFSSTATVTTPAVSVGVGWGDGPWGDLPWGGAGVEPVPIPTTYRLVLATRGTSGLGTPIITDVLAAGVPMQSDAVGRWSRTLNAAGTLEFSLPIDGCTPDDFAPGQRELHLYRDDGGGERLVWAGHLWTADVSAPWVRFLGMGFYEALRHREMSDDFYDQSVEQRAIAWQLIDYTQNQPGGALGITRATAAGSPVARTILYCAEERQVIADAIEDLASADDGFDFDITPDKVWRTWTPERGVDLSATVELDTQTTIVDLAYSVDATQVENDVAGIGAKGDCEPIHFVRSVDTASRDAYGLMQGTVNRSDIKDDDAFITALSAERLALLKDARKQPTMRLFQDLGGPSPLSGDFDIGDTIAVRSAWGYASFHEKFRVMSYSVSFDRVGNEMLELVLDARGAVTATTEAARTIAVTTTLSPTVGLNLSGVSRARSIGANTTVTPNLTFQVRKHIDITEATGHTNVQAIAVGTTVTAAMSRIAHTPVAKAIAAASTVTAALATLLRHPASTLKTIAASTTLTPTLDTNVNIGGAFRAFSAGSYWNTPLPSSGVVHPDSATYIAWMKANLNNAYLTLSMGAFAMPIYWSTLSDPLVTITPTGSGPTVTFRLPAGATPMTGNDQAMLIIDRTTNQDVQLFEFTRTPVPGATGVARYYLDSNGLAGDVTGHDNVDNDGHRGIAGSTHAIRHDEVAAGAIRHRTKFAMGQPGNTPDQPIWPMDGFESPRTGIIPEGVVMRIRSSYTLPSSLTPSARIIAQHLQTYGTLLGDTGGAGHCSVKLEATDWTSLNVTSSSLKNIPWDAYEFVVAGWGQ